MQQANDCLRSKQPVRVTGPKGICCHELLLVEDDPRFHESLRLRIAKAAKGETPTLFEATTLSDPLPILQAKRIDTVLSDGAFPPD